MQSASGLDSSGKMNASTVDYAAPRRWGERILARIAPLSFWIGESTEARRGRTLLMLWLTAALPAAVAFAIIYGVLLDCREGALVCLASLLGFLVVPAIIRITGSATIAANWILVCTVACLTALCAIVGGTSAPAVRWLACVPMIAIYLAGMRIGLLWTALVVLELCVLKSIELTGITLPNVLEDPDLADRLNFFSTVGLVLLMAVLAGGYEVQRQRAQQLSDTIIQNLPGVFLVFDKDGRVLRWNRKVREVTGLSDNELRRLGPSDFLVPQDREKTNREFERTMINGASELDANVLTRDGKSVPFFITGIRAELGGDECLIALGLDVSELKRAEAALRESESRWRTIVDAVQAGILIVDAATREIVLANPTALKLFGSSNDSVIGRVCHEFICPAERDQCPVMDLSQTVDQSERELVTVTGQRKPILKTVLPIRIDDRDCLLESFVDLTNLKRAEAELRASEALHRNLVQNSPMGMIFFDLREDDLVITEANPAACVMANRPRSELVGKTLEEAFPGVVRTQLPDRFRSAARDGTIWQRNAVRYTDGYSSGDFDLRAFQTSPGKMILVYTDVTSREEAEAALRRSEREIALQSGRAQVATDVLHNVGNVLNSVNVAATLVNDRLRKSEAPTLKMASDLLLEHGEDLERFLTDDDRGRRLPEFLAQLAEVLAEEQQAVRNELDGLLGSVEHIRQVISMQQVYGQESSLLEEIRPVDIVEQALSISAHSFTRHEISVSREFEAIGSIPLERHKILQILVNIISNAKHSVIAQRPDRPHVTVRLFRTEHSDGDRFSISVTDNGVGIATADLDKIFRHGFTTKSDGHGFGLHSAVNLAQSMGGRLAVSSEGPGQGATFTLELPMSRVEVTS